MTSADNRSDELLNALSVQILNIGTYQLPKTDGTSGQVLTTNGTGLVIWNGLVNNGNILLGKLGTTQTTNLAFGDHIKFDVVSFVSGTDIVLDTSSPYSITPGVASIGRVTLAPNKTYFLECWLVRYNATALTIGWSNATDGTSIDGSTSDNYSGCLATFTPSISTLVNVKILSSTLPINVSNCYFRITEMG